jgi:hypothetical protein
MTDLNESLIIPNKRAAGINLRAFEKTVLKHWGEPNKIEIELSKRKKIIYDNVIFYFNNGKIDQIELNNDYKGKTKDGIKLGSSKSEIENKYGQLIWDGAWSIDCMPYGMGFDFIAGKKGEKIVANIFIFEQ